MRYLARCVLSFSTAVTMLAGCMGSQSPIGAPGAMPQNHVVAPNHAIRHAFTSRPYQVLYSFAWGTSDGSNPAAGLIGVEGTLYGTTENGGGGCDSFGPGCGTVYRVTTTGTEKVLHDFRHHRRDLYTDEPLAGLIDVNGTLYGTTAGGGGRKGTVFGISTAGQITILHVFSPACEHDDGLVPQARLIDVKGTLYGTTYFGGSCKDRHEGFGTVYSISMAGQEKVVYRFKGGSDGANPQASLIDVNGTLYGTTAKGGGSGNWGTVFTISATGKEKVLHRFNGSEGANPQAGLIYVKGALYGTTSRGGSKYQGTVYRMSTSGKEKVLYSFRGGSDGSEPEAPLIDVNGILYGTTYWGCLTSTSSSPGCGTVFSVTRKGLETVLHHFAGGSDGAYPNAGLVNVNGTLYGTTSQGGYRGGGTVFAVTP